MERIIIHSDINHCYAQIEEVQTPWLRKIPMAVGGHEANRHGIILAKNDIAKTYGIKTGESLRDAYKKCPNLYIVHPHYDEYLYYTEKVKDIYRQYSHLVEPFGLDEAWIDLTGTEKLFQKSPITLAKEIQQRVYEETGLTVSMGVSFNKVFAKLGSDIDKHSGFVVIDDSHYKDIVWPMPVEDLLYVGRKTKEKLNLLGIMTIGDLAKSSLNLMKKQMGKNGEMIWRFANGMDNIPVLPTTYKHSPKSVGNGITTKHDIHNISEARLVIQILAESISKRLRGIHKMGWVVQVSFRYKTLKTVTRQQKLESPTQMAKEILQYSLNILNTFWNQETPLRSLTVSINNLIHENDVAYQENFFSNEAEVKYKENKLEEAIYTIQSQYGKDYVIPCSKLLDKELTDFSTDLGDSIHPPGFMR